MASHDANRSPEVAIHFGSIDLSLDGKDKVVRAPEARPPPQRSLGSIAGASGGPRVDWTPGATIRFGSLEFVINGEGTTDRATEALVL